MAPACTRLVEVPEPKSGINGNVAFVRDATAIAVMTQVYNNMWGLSATINGFGSFTSFSADELVPYDLGNYNSEWLVHYKNELTPENDATLGFTYNFWKAGYSAIFVSNSVLEGIALSTSLNPLVKQQLEGEAKFMRAMHHFYLCNLFGDIPLALSTDYKVTAALSRTTVAKVYEQVIADLKDAAELLSENYLNGTLLETTNERIRPTKWAATALLAKCYLFAGQYEAAATEAGKVIAETNLYKVAETPLKEVFIKNSAETIWALPPVYAWKPNTDEGYRYILTDVPSSRWTMYLSDHVVNNFEAGDKRKTDWVGFVDLNGKRYHFPYKYKEGPNSFNANEYTVLMRAGEVYLIRAEARARLQNITGANSAASDLNVIRTRAGLPNTTAATDSAMLEAILKEKQSELFTEAGSRWLDLIRFGKIDAVMQSLNAEKGTAWESFRALAPIAQQEIERNPNLAGHQNPGYTN